MPVVRAMSAHLHHAPPTTAPPIASPRPHLGLLQVHNTAPTTLLPALQHCTHRVSFWTRQLRSPVPVSHTSSMGGLQSLSAFQPPKKSYTEQHIIIYIGSATVQYSTCIPEYQTGNPNMASFPLVRQAMGNLYM